LGVGVAKYVLYDTFLRPKAASFTMQPEGSDGSLSEEIPFEVVGQLPPPLTLM
jgi:hypothetical protein